MPLRDREIRWLLLQALHEARRAGKAQSGGWVSQFMLLEIMSVQGYDLTIEELQDELEYLIDKHCTQKERIGPRANKYRILAEGMDVLDGQTKISGIGIVEGK